MRGASSHLNVMPRNRRVEEAVTNAVALVDEFVAGAEVRLPSPPVRRLIDHVLSTPSASARLAIFFFTSYSVVAVDEWDYNELPVGVRGTYGDKRLSAEMSTRHVTLHDNVTAFAENLGWKGGVRQQELQRDPRFAPLLQALATADPNERILACHYIASKFAASRRTPTALPPVGEELLTYAKAKALFHALLEVESEGHVQQFMIAALLHVHRSRLGAEIRTHHPHAADTYDRTAGDIEEFLLGELHRAYEVTVRPDWMNRLHDFKAKMDKFGLSKYVIIASNVNSVQKLSDPARFLLFMEDIGRDIAVIDILDFVHVFSAELSASELRDAVNQCYDYLLNPKLSGRPSIQEKFIAVVGAWLDEVTPA